MASFNTPGEFQAPQVPTDPGMFWGRLKSGTAWLKLRAVWRSEGPGEPMVLGVEFPGEFRPVRDFEWELDWPLNAASPGEVLPPSPPVVARQKADRLGGYASPATVGDVTVGGLTVWDHYVMAAIPAVVARVDSRDPDQWARVGMTAAMVADLALLERKKRENDDAR